MSVESEILRIQHNISSAYTKVAEKGGEVPLQPNSQNLAKSIETIQSSGELIAGDGLSKKGNVLNVDLPTKSVTKAEYDALTEEEKQAEVLYLVESSIADALGLGRMVPPGAIIPFMGLRAPSGYLVCDGAEHSISQYPHLAQYFEAQFGAKNHFGGDGTDTFAVPDMRNLFLRGYRGDSEEQLSGEIGDKQEATLHPRIFSSSANLAGYIGAIPDRVDSTQGENTGSLKISTSNGTAASGSTLYTSRPVNMAILYCIKT